MSTSAKEQRRARINQKGWEVYQRITALRAGQDASLADLDLDGIGQVGESRIERLERFLAQINAARTRLESPEYGQCLGCGGALGDAALDELPWAEFCQACDANKRTKKNVG